MVKVLRQLTNKVYYGPSKYPVHGSSRVRETEFLTRYLRDSRNHFIILRPFRYGTLIRVSKDLEDDMHPVVLPAHSRRIEGMQGIGQISDDHIG